MNLKMYEELGFKLFLCNTDKSPKVEWKDPKNHLTIEEAEKYQQQDDILIGAWIPSNIKVFDLDRHANKPDGFREFDRISKQYEFSVQNLLENTFCVKTAGKGLHMYFADSENRKRDVAPGIEDRGNAFYVIAAGSKGYTPVKGNTKIIPFPPQIKKWLSDVESQKPSKEKTEPFLPPELLKEVLDEIDIIKFAEANESWLAFVTSCIATFGETEEVYDLLEDWSRQEPGYEKNRLTRKRLQSLKADGAVGVGTFFKFLKDEEIEPALISKVRKAINDKPDEDPILEKGDTTIPPPWCTAEELIEEAGEFKYILEPFLAEKNVTLLEGYTGSGKTITAYEICKSLLSGKPLLGEYEPAKRVGPILYFDQDNPSNEVGERFRKIGLLGFQKKFSYYHFKSYDFENKDKLRELGKIIQYYKPCLVVFDTLIKFHTADENSSTEMNPIMKRIRQIANLGPAVLVLHQLNKTENARKGGRGSNEIQSSVDMEFVILEKREQGLLTIESAKSRRERVEKIYMKIESTETEIKMVKADQEDQELATMENIVMMAGKEGVAIKDIEDELKNDYGIKKSRATTKRNLRKLIGGSKIKLNGGEGDRNSRYVHRSFD